MFHANVIRPLNHLIRAKFKGFENMECKNSSLLFFDKPGVLTDIQHRNIVGYYPLTTLTSESPIEIKIPGSAEDYIDLGDINLYVKFKIVAADGTAIKQADDVVGLNNLPISTIWSDARLKIGETQIEGGQTDYAYRSYFKTVTQFSPQAQTSQMEAMGWYKDEAGKFDNASNKGFVKRKQLVGDSKVIEFMGPLMFDFFNQNRHLLSKMDMIITLTPNKSEFFLNSYAASGKMRGYKIEFLKAAVYAGRLEMNPSVINGHAVGLNTDNARYFINHSDLFVFSIPAGQASIIKENLLNAMKPKMLVVAMVENDAYNGNISKNPFNFQHFDLVHLQLTRDGRTMPGGNLEPNFKENEFLHSYVQTMKAFDYWNTDDTNGLKPHEWANGYNYYAFDLTPDKEASSSCLHAHTSGNLRLELKFANKLTSTVNVIVYAVSDSQVEVTKNRDVILHYMR